MKKLQIALTIPASNDKKWKQTFPQRLPSEKLDKFSKTCMFHRPHNRNMYNEKVFGIFIQITHVISHEELVCYVESLKKGW